MWLMAKIGFFSIVEDATNRANLLVRGRARRDVERFLGEARAMAGTALDLAATERGVVETPTADYQFRASLPRGLVASVVGGLAVDVEYRNFKGEIGRDDAARAHTYHKVWEDLLEIQRGEARDLAAERALAESMPRRPERTSQNVRPLHEMQRDEARRASKKGGKRR